MVCTSFPATAAHTTDVPAEKHTWIRAQAIICLLPAEISVCRLTGRHSND